MLTIAFDVGVKHLSYCGLDEDSKIRHWGIIDITEGIDPKMCKDFHVLAVSLFDHLKHHFNDDMDITNIVIENQPVYKNPTMKSIQMCLYSFFAVRNMDSDRKIKLSFIGASTKVKLAEKLTNESCPNLIKELKERYKSKYTYNKKVSIECTSNTIRDRHLADVETFEYFNNSKKKDDLADAFLLALVHVEKLLKGNTRLHRKDE